MNAGGSEVPGHASCLVAHPPPGIGLPPLLLVEFPPLGGLLCWQRGLASFRQELPAGPFTKTAHRVSGVFRPRAMPLDVVAALVVHSDEEPALVRKALKRSEAIAHAPRGHLGAVLAVRFVAGHVGTRALCDERRENSEESPFRPHVTGDGGEPRRAP